jgi:hypothetical protein
MVKRPDGVGLGAIAYGAKDDGLVLGTRVGHVRVGFADAIQVPQVYAIEGSQVQCGVA